MKILHVVVMICRKYVELEARYYQLHSKYLLVLNEMNKPQIGKYM